VLEGIPAELAQEITKTISIPTIGIGAGNACDGQIIVSTDMLGFDPDFSPKFVKRYANLSRTIVEAVQTYAKEVQSSEFPAEEHTFRQSPKAPARKLSAVKLAR
jgi:3-methyl-2-oxobutanoate hydroxymethyltransferase